MSMCQNRGPQKPVCFVSGYPQEHCRLIYYLMRNLSQMVPSEYQPNGCRFRRNAHQNRWSENLWGTSPLMAASRRRRAPATAAVCGHKVRQCAPGDKRWQRCSAKGVAGRSPCYAREHVISSGLCGQCDLRELKGNHLLWGGVPTILRNPF